MINPPSPVLTFIEPRAVFEYFGGRSVLPALRQLVPKGDHAPVMVLPGFMGSARSTLFLRRYLNAIGYLALDWGKGYNIGPGKTSEDELLRILQTVVGKGGRRVNLIGWSLGGVYARYLSHTVPQLIRSVITLGTPLRFPMQSAANTMYGVISGSDELPEYVGEIGEPPQVPATSIYSKSDGIVPWRSSLSKVSTTCENIRVAGSHCGLGYNPLVLWIIADRLAQEEGNWQPYSAPWIPNCRADLSRPGQSAELAD